MFSSQRGCCISTNGFHVSGLRLRGLFNKHVLHVPLALSCSGLLDTLSDAATPATVRAHTHLTQYTHQFPEFDPSAHTMVRLGRDCGEAMAAKLLSVEEPFWKSHVFHTQELCVKDMALPCVEEPCLPNR